MQWMLKDKNMIILHSKYYSKCLNPTVLLGYGLKQLVRVPGVN